MPTGTTPHRDPLVSLRRNPAFRTYRYGATLSNLGTYVQRVAQGWLVYQLTGSAALLAAVALASAVPGAIFALVGGVLGDRIARRRVMLRTQSAMAATALLLGGLTLSGAVQVWHVFALAVASGVLEALDNPARLGLTADLVREEDLPNAIAVAQVQFNLCRMLGPVVGGFLLATVGPGWCFVVNGLSYLAVVSTLHAVTGSAPAPTDRPPLVAGIRQGLNYVGREPAMRFLVALGAVPPLFVAPYLAMLPAVADTILRVGPVGLGVLQGALGAGSTVGAVATGSLGERHRTARTLVAAAIVAGAAVAAVGVSPVFGLSSALLALAGFAQMIGFGLNQVLIQRRVAPEMRSRVLGVQTCATASAQPLGAALAAVVATSLGPGLALAVGGGGAALAALGIWSRARLDHGPR